MYAVARILPKVGERGLSATPRQRQPEAPAVLEMTELISLLYLFSNVLPIRRWGLHALGRAPAGRHRWRRRDDAHRERPMT
jgi:hypothetical protein